MLSDGADIAIGGEARRSVGELDGKGEAVGGIVVSRFGANAYQVIADCKQKIEELKAGLPEGVNVVETYDRSRVIGRAVDTLTDAVLEELLVTGAICLVFLLHVRSALVALPVFPIRLLRPILLIPPHATNSHLICLCGPPPSARRGCPGGARALQGGKPAASATGASAKKRVWRRSGGGEGQPGRQ